MQGAPHSVTGTPEGVTHQTHQISFCPDTDHRLAGDGMGFPDSNSSSVSRQQPQSPVQDALHTGSSENFPLPIGQPSGLTIMWRQWFHWAHLSMTSHFRRRLSLPHRGLRSIDSLSTLPSSPTLVVVYSTGPSLPSLMDIAFSHPLCRQRCF